MAKTLDSFRAKHDPSYVIQTPQTVLRRDLRPGRNVFIFTAAQNGTPVHEDALACMLTAVKHRNAEFFVDPLRYKNPTSVWTGSQQNAEWWAPAVTPYLWNQRYAVNSNLTFMADIATQAAAPDPLGRLDAVSLASSAIFGHTKLQMRVVPTPGSLFPKIMTTTGACTLPNYTATPTGKIGEFHHSLSAVIVEVDGKTFHIRHLHYSEKSRRIIDATGFAYYADRVEKAPRALAVVEGDTHVRFTDPDVDVATHGIGGLIDTVDPLYNVKHDLLDGHTANRHHIGNYIALVAKVLEGKDSIRDEVGEAFDYLRKRRRKRTKVVIAGSNHHDFLGQAVQAFLCGGMKALPHISPRNAGFLAEIAAEQCAAASIGPGGVEYPEAFGLLLKRAKLKDVTLLGGDESFALGGVELGMHGHVGPNGARGSIKNLRRIGTKSIIGHGHSPGINEGCYQVGTSSRLRLEYTHGPSSWLNTHCVLNADGKRQLITIINGRWKI